MNRKIHEKESWQNSAAKLNQLYGWQAGSATILIGNCLRTSKVFFGFVSTSFLHYSTKHDHHPQLHHSPTRFWPTATVNVLQTNCCFLFFATRMPNKLRTTGIFNFEFRVASTNRRGKLVAIFHQICDDASQIIRLNEISELEIWRRASEFVFTPQLTQHHKTMALEQNRHCCEAMMFVGCKNA